MHRGEPPKSSGKDFVIFPRVKCKEILQSILICCLTFCVQRVVHNADFSYINENEGLCSWSYLIACHLPMLLQDSESRLKKKLMHAMCLWSRTYCFGKNGSTCLLWWCSNNEEKCFPSTSKRSTSRREYFSWLVKLCVLSLRRKIVEVLL